VVSYLTNKGKKRALHRLPSNPNLAILMQWRLVAKHAMRRFVTAPRATPAASLLQIHVLDYDIQLRGPMNLSQTLIAVIPAVDLASSTTLRGGQLERLELRLRLGAAVGLRVGRASGAAEVLGVGVVFGLALGQAHDEGGHGHFDVEFDHVDDGVELDVDDLVFEEHEAD
jgi:hypothetical protein